MLKKTPPSSLLTSPLVRTSRPRSTESESAHQLRQWQLLGFQHASCAGAGACSIDREGAWRQDWSCWVCRPVGRRGGAGAALSGGGEGSQRSTAVQQQREWEWQNVMLSGWQLRFFFKKKRGDKDSVNSLMAAGRFLQKSGKFMTLLIIPCKSSCLTKL